MTVMLWKCWNTKTPDTVYKIEAADMDNASEAARMIDPGVNAFQPYDAKYDDGRVYHDRSTEGSGTPDC